MTERHGGMMERHGRTEWRNGGMTEYSKTRNDGILKHGMTEYSKTRNDHVMFITML